MPQDILVEDVTETPWDELVAQYSPHRGIDDFKISFSSDPYCTTFTCNIACDNCGGCGSCDHYT